jgi:hypothetical protein
VLIDADHIVQTTTTVSSTKDESKNSDNLKSVLKEYDAIIIKIADGKIGLESLYPFFLNSIVLSKLNIFVLIYYYPML